MIDQIKEGNGKSGCMLWLEGVPNNMVGFQNFTAWLEELHVDPKAFEFFSEKEGYHIARLTFEHADEAVAAIPKLAGAEIIKGRRLASVQQI